MQPPLRFLALLLPLLLAPPPATAQDLSGKALVEALRRGGHVIYFRHAATNWDQDDRIGKVGDWQSCDPSQMRQLSDAGRDAARRIGAAIRSLGIPVARVISSEYCRAAETARLLDLGPVLTTPDIMNMRAADYVGGAEAVTRRARRVLSEAPPPSGNTVVVGHGNLMQAATGGYTGEGGSGIYRPAAGSERGFVDVAKLAAEDWKRLADSFSR